MVIDTDGRPATALSVAGLMFEPETVMKIDTRPRPGWTPETNARANAIEQGCALMGSLMRRCAGIEKPPMTRVGQFRRETPVTVTGVDLPHGYLIVIRRENEKDPGVLRAYGPDGWEKDNVTPMLAAIACWEHHEAQPTTAESKEP